MNHATLVTIYRQRPFQVGAPVGVRIRNAILGYNVL
jgi:hypothetical protein